MGRGDNEFGILHFPTLFYHQSRSKLLQEPAMYAQRDLKILVTLGMACGVSIRHCDCVSGQLNSCHIFVHETIQFVKIPFPRCI